MQTNVTGTVWAVPEKALEIIVSAGALADVTRDLSTRREHAAGIFLAPDSPKPVRRHLIEHTLAVGDDQAAAGLLGGVEALEDIILMWRETPRFPGPVGFYIAEDVDPESYCRKEYPQLRKYLKGETNFLVFARFAGDVCTATLAVVHDGEVTISANQVTLDVQRGTETATPFSRPNGDAALNRGAAAPMPERGRSSLTESQVEAPRASRQPSAAVPRGSRKLILAGAVLILGAAAAALWISDAGRLLSGIVGRTAGTGTPTSTAPLLDLRVVRRGGDFEVSWDRNAAAVQSAQRGFLYINDGGNRTQVFLEQAHVRSGHVMYVPRSADVDIRLELVTPDDRLVRESVRVLQASAPESTKAPGVTLTPSAAPIEAPRPEATKQRIPATAAPAKAEEAPNLTATEPEQPRRVFLPPAQQASSYPAGSARVETVALPQIATTAADFSGGSPTLPSGMPAPPPRAAATQQANRASEPQAVRATESQAVRTPEAQGSSSPDPRSPVSTLLSTDRVAPVPVRQIPVQVPASIRAMLTGEAAIEITLQVDASGRVTKAQPARQDSVVKSHLASFAVDALRGWQFMPATRSGKPIASSYTVVFRFKK